MGIDNFNSFAPRFEPGLYNKNDPSTTYSVYFDGNLMAYKGATRQHMDRAPRHDIETSIAQNSLIYVRTLTKYLEAHMYRSRLKNVFVMLDGHRHPNKRERPTEIVRSSSSSGADRNDEGTVRICRARLVDAFAVQCEKWSRCTVVRLNEHEEAEMMMYRLRDRENGLNLLVSEDSDVYPIVYGHEPIVENRIRKDENVVSYDTSNALVYGSIRDTNYNYKPNFVVRDSCALVVCKRGFNINVVGFDHMRSASGSLRLSPLVFKIMCAMCGNDWLDRMITPTMIRCIVSEECVLSEAENVFLRYFDDAESVFRVVCSLLVIGLRGGARAELPRRAAWSDKPVGKFTPSKLIDNVRRYVGYVSGDGLDRASFERYDSVEASRSLIESLVGSRDSRTQKRACSSTDVCSEEFLTKVDRIVKDDTAAITSCEVTSSVPTRQRQIPRSRSKDGERIEKRLRIDGEPKKNVRMFSLSGNRLESLSNVLCLS
ncbi:hypothetical protein QAD02_001448 [Eretmocerus hayati]|uniref:Uncharacterized protein n=1 Tax=Eretmocerus hayati TaxID=131215 RepID=A0ACC2NIN4_9HYME|nr:hypothetical protein QAD02_001448 [Eretmocerus hayati]